jgi:cytoskeleton protein RodZ
MTRVLKPGDTYEVPDTTGLRLVTGNAGGLEIVVDGEVVPSLGRAGDVVRNVALDAERLKAGTAVRR